MGTNQKRILQELLKKTHGVPFYRYAGMSGGTDTAAINIIGNHSPGAPGDYVILPEPDKIIHITSMNVLIRDAAAIRADRYGGLTELTNGMSVCVFNPATGEIVDDFTAGHKITNNAEWAGHADTLDILSFASGDGFVSARWTAQSIGGRDIALDGRQPFALLVRAEDNLSALTAHHFKFGGWQEAIPGVGL